MPLVEWKPIYSVGIDMIDAQHQKIIGYMNRFHDANAAGNPLAAKSALAALVEYTKLHFSEEEAMMSRNGYPDFPAHKKTHGDLLNLVQRLVTNYSAQPDIKNAESLSNFLKTWLLNHILGVDKKYVPYVTH